VNSPQAGISLGLTKDRAVRGEAYIFCKLLRGAELLVEVLFVAMPLS